MCLIVILRTNANKDRTETPKPMQTNPTIATRRSRRSFEKLNSLKMTTDPKIMESPRTTIDASIKNQRGEHLECWSHCVVPRSLITFESLVVVAVIARTMSFENGSEEWK
jgi:hypothetical protein